MEMTYPTIQPGVYFDMPEHTYHAIPAFSKSLVKKFRISDIDAWESLYGEKKEESNDALLYGSALHCLVLEGREAFDARYCKAFDKSEHPDALDTMDDMKKFLDGQGRAYPKSASKGALADIVAEHFPDRPILERLKTAHNEASKDKTMLAASAYDEIVAREWVRNVSFMQDAQHTEVSFFWHDSHYDIPCKARLDAIAFRQGPLGKVALVGDIKTFTNRNQKPVAQAVAYDSGVYGYHIDAVFYTRAIKVTPRIFHDREDFDWPDFDSTSFELLFVEKGKPFPNVLPREVCVREGDSFTELGNAAMASIQDAANRYKSLHDQHGRKPWNSVHRHDAITEADIPMYLL